MNRINLFPPNQASKTPIPTFHNHYPKPIVQFQYNQSINNTSIIIKVFLLWIWIWRKEETLMNPSTEKSTHYDPFGFAEGKERMKIEGWSAMTQQYTSTMQILYEWMRVRSAVDEPIMIQNNSPIEIKSRNPVLIVALQLFFYWLNYM
jgi:hypothetical protein